MGRWPPTHLVPGPELATHWAHASQVESAADIASAERLIFPGVGAFGQAMDILRQRGYTQALRDYVLVRDHAVGRGGEPRALVVRPRVCCV